MPRRLNRASCTTVSSAVPAASVRPAPQYSPSVFSRTTTKSIERGVPAFRGESSPASSLTGRRFTYWSKPWRMGSSSPRSETWSGTPGKPTAPSRMASQSASRSRPSAGIMAPSRR